MRSNYFDEIVVCFIEQGFDEYAFRLGKKIFLSLEGFNKAVETEFKIMSKLK